MIYVAFDFDLQKRLTFEQHSLQKFAVCNINVETP